MRSITVVACIVLALGALVALPAPAPARAAASQPESAIVDGAIPDAAALKTLLESLEFTPSDSGNGVWTVARTNNNWTLNISLQVNVNATTVWITCYIGTLEQPETYANAHYLGLLDMQARFSPRFFFTTQDANGLRLYYGRGLDNRGLTPELVSSEIAMLQDSLASNASVWNYNTWTREGDTGAPAPAEAPAPGGN